MKLFPKAFVLILLLLASCTTRPLKGGKTIFQGSGPASAKITTQQSENPQMPTSNDYERTKETTLDIPAGSIVEKVSQAPNETNTTRESVVLAGPTRQVVKETEKTKTTIGAAQKDTARELGAKMKAAGPLLFIGILCLLGAGAFVYFKWFTPGIIAGGTGIVLISLYFMLPSITPMMWLLIALGVIGAAAVTLLVFYAHGRGEWDKNNNFIPDKWERKKPEGNNPS